MLTTGQIHTLTVLRLTEHGAFLDDGDRGILLPKKYVEDSLQIGDEIDVFVYTDSEDRPVATTRKPLAMAGDFAAMRVVETMQYGVFLDWGLEKDLFLPRDYIHGHPQVGDIMVVKVIVDDRTNRLIAVSKLKKYFNRNTTALREGMQVDLIFYHFSDIGAMAVVNNEYEGLLHDSDILKPIEIGDSSKGYIKQITPEGKLTLSLRKGGYEEIAAEIPVIRIRLQEAGGFLPYNDKSSPEEIRRVFGLSKKEFKKIIGGLYKERIINIEENGIRTIR